jgi:hypothetical protein
MQRIIILNHPPVVFRHAGKFGRTDSFTKMSLGRWGILFIYSILLDFNKDKTMSPFNN